MTNLGPEWRIWENIKIFPIFYSIFIKFGQEAHFSIQNNMEPSKLGYEHYDRRATGYQKSCILKI